MKVALFTTCLNDALYPQVAKSTVELLERLAITVVVPEGQICCGQMHLNSGYSKQASGVVANHVKTFDQALETVDFIVSPSGSCVGCVRHQHAAASRHGGPVLAEASARVSERTYELTEFLVDVMGLTDVGAVYPYRVAYHPTCHSLRLLRVGDRPLSLLRHVRGIDLVDLPDGDQCCGFGGTFALKNPDVSSAMLEDKVASVLSTGADVCVATDSSCLMHIGGGLSRTRTGVRHVHLAEILASTGAP